MCGIAGIHIKDTSKGLPPKVLERFVDHLLLGIEHRGTDATGMVAVSEGGSKVLMRKNAVEASVFIKDRPSLAADTRTVLLHTRYATQGHQSDNGNNHPVLYRTCFATHNGHINNDTELFTEYGLKRNAEVDSEVIAALFSEHGLDKAHKALQELDGGFAIAVIDPIESPDKLILAKGRTSPLIYFENSQFIVWASTLDAITNAWGHSLGTPPKPSKFWELQEGVLMLVEKGESELLGFKVKERSWRSSWSSSGHNSWNAYERESAKTCKACGCTGFYHAGEKYDGPCIARPVEMQGEYCRCMGFVSMDAIERPVSCDTDEAIPDHFEECDSCYDFFPPSQIEIIWEDFSMCEGCLYASNLLKNDGTVISKECTHRECGVTCRAQMVGTSLSLVDNGSWECIHAECGRTCTLVDKFRVPETILGVKVFAEEDDAEPGIWTPKEGPADNDQRHESIIAAVSKESGFHPAFVKWILFEADLAIADDDPWLANTREMLDTAYADTEERFNELEVLAREARNAGQLVI